MHATRLCLAGLLGCAGCTAAQAPPIATLAPPPSPAANCRSYSSQVVIDNTAQTLTGTACRQADGSWRIAQTVGGQPGAVVVVYPPANYAYAPDQAWLWAMPAGLGFGLDAFVFEDHDHRFHVFRRFHDFDHDHNHAHFLAHRAPSPSPAPPPGFHPWFAPPGAHPSPGTHHG